MVRCARAWSARQAYVVSVLIRCRGQLCNTAKAGPSHVMVVMALLCPTSVVTGACVNGRGGSSRGALSRDT